MSVQRHLVVIPEEDGGIRVYPLKEWLRQNPEHMPPTLDPNPSRSTSHQLRGGLIRMGWKKQETPTEFRLLPPDAGLGPEIDELLGAADEDVEATDDLTPYFSLEYQLRDFLAANIDTIRVNGRRLRLFIDEVGRDGIEYPSAVGPIDILAVDESGSFYVFELKRATSPDRAMGQVARYMGWVRQTIGRNAEVFGVIVAKTISGNLKYAGTIVPNVFLFEYEVSFTLNEAHELDPITGR